MNSLQKAQRFPAGKSGALALILTALAALTAISVPARAEDERTLIFSSSGCSVTPGAGDTSSVSGNCTVSPVPAGAEPSASGLRLSGAGAASGEGTLALEFSAFGGASGSFTGALPVAWHFILSSDTSIIDYTLDISAFTGSVGGSGGGTAHIPAASGSVVSGTKISGRDFLALSDDTTAWAIDLKVSAAGATALAVNIQDASGIEINPSPEPASFLLLGSGVLFLPLRRGKKSI